MFKVTLVDYDSDLFDITTSTLSDMRETLSAVDATLDLDQRRTEALALEMAQDADLVMIQSVRPLLNERTIPQLSQCRGIIRLGLGYDSVDVAAATRAGIPVSNVVNWCSDEVAEHAIALLFASVRRLARLDGLVSGGEWEREAAVPIRRMRGKTLGLVGLGRIGRAVAERMRGFGLRMLAYDPYVDADVMSRYGVRKTELDDLLQSADFITVHTPLTDETRHLLGERAFGLMKEGVFIVNTSRGPVVQESALVTALRSGKVWGAGLDVMEQEPLPADSALCEFGNVTLTPHIASYSLEAVETLYHFGAEIAADLLRGRWVSTIVNPQVRAKAEERWETLSTAPG